MDNAEGMPLFDMIAQFEEWEDEKTRARYTGMRHTESLVPHGIARCVSADGNNILEASYVDGEEQGLSILFANNTVHVYLNLRGQNGQLTQQARFDFDNKFQESNRREQDPDNRVLNHLTAAHFNPEEKNPMNIE